MFSAQQERLQQRLAEPRTADALERLLDKLDVIVFGVDAIDSLLRRSEEVADSLSGMIDDLKSLGGSEHTAQDFVSALPQLARTGTQVAAVTQRPAFQNLLESGLIDQLGDPRTIANLQEILSKLELVAFTMTAVDGFIKRGDEITDSVAESLGEARKLAESLDLESLKVLPQVLDALPSLFASGVLEQLPDLTKAAKLLTDSGILNSGVLKSFSETGQMLSDSYEEAKRAPVRKTTLLGLLKALQDPAVNRSVTLAIEVARQFGGKMQ